MDTCPFVADWSAISPFLGGYAHINERIGTHCIGKRVVETRRTLQTHQHINAYTHKRIH